MELPPQTGKCIVDGLELLLKSGCPRPGTGGKDVGYIVRLDSDGEVTGVDIAISDRFMGRLLDECN